MPYTWPAAGMAGLNADCWGSDWIEEGTLERVRVEKGDLISQPEMINLFLLFTLWGDRQRHLRKKLGFYPNRPDRGF